MNVLDAIELFETPDTVRCRLCLGYVLTGGDLYHREKRGAMIPISTVEALTAFLPETQDLLRDAAVRSWEAIPSTGEIAVPVYAWQLGVPYETSDDGVIMGDWPQVGTLTLSYTEKFLMPGGKLPEVYQGLRHWRLG